MDADPTNSFGSLLSNILAKLFDPIALQKIYNGDYVDTS